ncbi:hypothetical protein [Ciceribacter selenitireducens]|uniref:hypothetical protein n=1 Tax=Ciceribacter selenitireducens TaxID=448181 RepID=UPI0011AFE520|nr:hypothetical protein [Ciceribacter selenitireducens]
MEENKQTVNWFVRIMIIALSIMLGAMVLYKFVAISPEGEISAGVVSFICLILVLVLSEAFDSFSIGKMISISREVKKKEKEVSKLELQNSQLLSQLIAISNNQSQHQQHTNIYGDYHTVSTVQKATDQEVEDKQTAEASITTPPAVENGGAVAGPAIVRTDWRRAEEIALNKYVQQKKIDPLKVISDAKLVNHFEGVDPISKSNYIYDAYIRDTDSETFVEIKNERVFSPILRDRIYVLLSKINYYRNSKRVDAHLDLVIMKIPGEEPSRFYSDTRFFESFSPAIASGLLNVVLIEFSADEAATLRE